MKQAKDAVDLRYTQLQAKFEKTSLKDIHAPSFLLGCFSTILLLVLQPVFRALVGGILVSVITVIKYIVIVGGVTLCGVILTSKRVGRAERAAAAAAAAAVPSAVAPSPRDQFIRDASAAAGAEADDLDIVGYNEAKAVRRKERRSAQTAYEAFVRQAARSRVHSGPS